jgi:hypothetical protein
VRKVSRISCRITHCNRCAFRVAKKRWRLCFTDFSVPETRFLPEEDPHHLNAGGVIQDREYYTVRAEEIFGADAFVFTPGATLEVLFAN